MEHMDEDELRTSMILAVMPENTGIRIMEKDGDYTNLYAEHLSRKDLYNLSRSKTQLHIVTMALRPGAPEFVRAVEMRMYPPTKPTLNKLFEMRYFKWHQILWVITSVPFSDKKHVENLAREYEMGVNLGIPHMFGSTTDTVFPMNAPGSENNVCTLEGLGGAPYTNERSE